MDGTTRQILEIITEIQEQMATKSDVAMMPTKSDLYLLATKEDVEKVRRDLLYQMRKS